MDNPLDHRLVVDAFPELELHEEPLGQGGMKNAYRGTLVGEDIVLKVIRQPLDIDEGEFDQTALPERLIREIDGMKSVEHPSLVRILQGPDVKEIAGAHRGWYLEPYYPGGELTKRLGSAWAEADVLDLMERLIGVVGALAASSIVHRDIKPDNIVYDADDQPVVLDLGIALFLDRTPLTASAAPSPRTPTFAAPEQFEPRRTTPLDFRTDLFLVGMVGFWACTGVHPFNPDDRDGYLARLVDGEFDTGALDAAPAGNELKEVLRRLLNKHPSGRYRKVEHAVEALKECRG